MARCTVERRMRALGLSGAAPGRKPRATGPAKGNPVPGDLLRRDFTATGPNRRWVVDFTHVPTWSGFCYTAFVMDLFSRRIVGWATSARMDTDFVLGALEQAIWTRKHRDGGDLEGLVHHSDHGSQYLSIAYTGRLVDEGIEASAGAVGSSYAGAAAEALGKSYKRGARSGATAPGRTAPTSRPPPPSGWTGTTAPAPTAPTPTTSHPPPPNTATIATTPPPPPRHPPRHNQPSTKPGTIQARVVGLCERGWGRRGLG